MKHADEKLINTRDKLAKIKRKHKVIGCGISLVNVPLKQIRSAISKISLTQCNDQHNPGTSE